MQKKIALINDVTGFGRCSIAVMAPIVSAMKIQAVTIPTAILSAHTQFPEYYFDDYTSKMPEYIKTYKDLHLSFDAISTGFLGSAEQADIVEDFIKTFKNDSNFVLVDPVMGDYGKLYKTYTPEMCEKMKGLVKYADILTPNLTELCTLLGRDYPEAKNASDHSIVTEEQLSEMCSELAAQGPKHIVVTGINCGSKIANFIYSRSVQKSDNGACSDGNNCGNSRDGARSEKNHGGEYCFVLTDRIGGDRSGTGDVISSIIAGMYANGHSIYESVEKAADFVSKCIRYCEDNHVPNHYGLCFEMFLKDLSED